MGEIWYNTSTAATAAHAAHSTSSPTSSGVILTMSGHVGVIIILSMLVIAGILFFVCGLLWKAEAHLQTGRENMHEELLFDGV